MPTTPSLRALAAARSAADRAAVAAACEPRCTGRGSTPAPRRCRRAIGPMANARTYEPGPPASATPGRSRCSSTGFVSTLPTACRIGSQAPVSESTPTTSLAALPTVTADRQAGARPRTGRRARPPGRISIRPTSATGTKASIQVLRALMAEHGVQVLDATETGDPSGAAWTEAGEIDHRGHDVGVRLVDYLDEEVERVVARIRELLDAGWQQVDVVTDHGWILLPGGMEKVELPAATTEIKKGRCARLKDGAVGRRRRPCPGSGTRTCGSRSPRASPASRRTRSTSTAASARRSASFPASPSRAGAARQPTGGPEITKVKWLGLALPDRVQRA